MRVVRERLRCGDTDHELLWSLVGIAAFILGSVSVQRFGVPPIGCVFKAVSGLPCPTCGAGRACVALVAGEVGTAFRANPLITVAVLGWGAYVPYGLLAWLRGEWRLRVRMSKREWIRVRIGAGLVLATTWLFLIIDGR
jgi:hypothetical protein